MSAGIPDGVTELRSATQLAHALQQLAWEIHTAHPVRKLALVGIRKRGGPLAQRLARLLPPEQDVVVGEVDITFHRDDLHNLEAMLDLGRSKMAIPDLEDRCVILFDDVLYTGRTIRAAIDELLDFGRPAKIELAVLVDRGHRELPIQPDYVGVKHVTQPGEYIRVLLREEDGEDGIYLHQQKERTA